MTIVGGKPVVVVGAGPVGLSVALALRQAGVDVVVLEQKPAIPRDHRATTLQPRSLELLARWRVLDPVLQAGVRVDRLQYWDWSPGPALLADLSYDAIRADTPCPYRVHLEQFAVCDVLAEALERGRPGTIAWGHRVHELVDYGDHVGVTVMDRENRLIVHRASLVVAADGHGSAIRDHVGAKLVASGAAVVRVRVRVPDAGRRGLPVRRRRLDHGDADGGSREAPVRGAAGRAGRRVGRQDGGPGAPLARSGAGGGRGALDERAEGLPRLGSGGDGCDGVRAGASGERRATAESAEDAENRRGGRAGAGAVRSTSPWRGCRASARAGVAATGSVPVRAGSVGQPPRAPRTRRTAEGAVPARARSARPVRGGAAPPGLGR